MIKVICNSLCVSFHRVMDSSHLFYWTKIEAHFGGLRVNRFASKKKRGRLWLFLLLLVWFFISIFKWDRPLYPCTKHIYIIFLLFFIFSLHKKTIELISSLFTRQQSFAYIYDRIHYHLECWLKKLLQIK